MAASDRQQDASGARRLDSLLVRILLVPPSPLTSGAPLRAKRLNAAQIVQNGHASRLAPRDPTAVPKLQLLGDTEIKQRAPKKHNVYIYLRPRPSPTTMVISIVVPEQLPPSDDATVNEPALFVLCSPRAYLCWPAAVFVFVYPRVALESCFLWCRSRSPPAPTPGNSLRFTGERKR